MNKQFYLQRFVLLSRFYKITNKSQWRIKKKTQMSWHVQESWVVETWLWCMSFSTLPWVLAVVEWSELLRWLEWRLSSNAARSLLLGLGNFGFSWLVGIVFERTRLKSCERSGSRSLLPRERGWIMDFVQPCRPFFMPWNTTWTFCFGTSGSVAAVTRRMLQLKKKIKKFSYMKFLYYRASQWRNYSSNIKCITFTFYELLRNVCVCKISDIFYLWIKTKRKIYLILHVSSCEEHYLLALMKSLKGQSMSAKFSICLFYLFLNIYI